MSEPITPAISDRITQHMNDDHVDALVLYATAYGNITEAQTAKMVSIDPQGMDLAVETTHDSLLIRIKFDHDLKDAEDAHHTLIDMIKQARKTK